MSSEIEKNHKQFLDADKDEFLPWSSGSIMASFLAFGYLKLESDRFLKSQNPGRDANALDFLGFSCKLSALVPVLGVGLHNGGLPPLEAVLVATNARTPHTRPKMVAREKSSVFRIAGHLAPQPGHALDRTLKPTIVESLSEEEKSRLPTTTTIVPYCYDNEQSVALVEFRGGFPAFLSELEGERQVEMGERDISFDCYYFGFTQLYTPEPDVPINAE